MSYLLDYDFTEQDIKDFEQMNKSFLVENVEKFKNIVEENINFLKELGVLNYKEIFNRHAEMFLMDNEAFSNIFHKYDRDDLIIKLKNNPDLVEQL